MAKRRNDRYARLDSGLMVPYWHTADRISSQRSVTPDVVQFNSSGQVLFTAGNVVSFGCAAVCQFCSLPAEVALTLPSNWVAGTCSSCSSLNAARYVLSLIGTGNASGCGYAAGPFTVCSGCTVSLTASIGTFSGVYGIYATAIISDSSGSSIRADWQSNYGSTCIRCLEHTRLAILAMHSWPDHLYVSSLLLSHPRRRHDNCMTSELCKPDAKGDTCRQCNWHNRFGPPFPIRPCDNPSDLRPAAERLGLADPLPAGMAPLLAEWIAAGEPMRTAEEEAACFAICENCQQHAALEDRCQSGQCSQRGRVLTVPRKLKTYHCPEKRWPT